MRKSFAFPMVLTKWRHGTLYRRSFDSTKRWRSIPLMRAAALLVLLCAVLPSAMAADNHSESLCDPVEGYYLPGGRDYRGHVNFTESGIPCQRWSEQRPHHHDTLVPDPLTGVGDHSYCRNPGGLERPGCFTMSASVRYQYCNIGAPCNYTPINPTLQLDPPSGTALARDQPIFMSCFPHPCLIYYTLNKTIPTLSIGLQYSRPIVLSRNSTINVLALFASNLTRRRQAFYTVPDPLPNPTAYFEPPSTEIYDGPVLVILKGLKKNDSVLIYRNEELRGVVYEGAFWLNETTNVTAVINAEGKVQAHYTILASGPSVQVYPSSGTFLGGINCLVYQSDPHATYALSVNASDWRTLSQPLFVIDTIGTTRLIIRATYLGGVQSMTWLTYTIIAASPPILSPSANIVYGTPVCITCSDPIGRLLVVSPLGKNGSGMNSSNDSSNRSRSRDDAINDGSNGNTGSDDENGLEVCLRTPGEFYLYCSYMDDLHHTWSASATYTLEPIPLQTPLVRPDCGRRFPTTPVLIEAKIIPPNAEKSSKSNNINGSNTSNDDYGSEVNIISNTNDESDEDSGYSRLSVLAEGTNASLRAIPSGDPLRALYVLQPSRNPPLNVTISLTVRSTIPLEGASLPCVCRYEFLPLGDTVTPYFVGRPTSSDPTAAVRRHLSACLDFATTDLIRGVMVGPFLLLNVVQLPVDLLAEYYTRAADCLRTAPINDVRNETSGTMELARWWTLDTWSSTTNTETTPSTAAPIVIIVSGWGLTAGAFRVARAEYGCDDIGILPTAQKGNSTILRLTFRIDTPGDYALCVTLNRATYLVPSVSPLSVVPRPWPLLHPAPCGGRQNMGAIIPLVAQISPRDVYLRTFFSINTGPWYVAQSGITLSVPPMTDSSLATAVALTAGRRAGASVSCVFFPPSRNGAPGRLSYRWAPLTASPRNEQTSNNDSTEEKMNLTFNVELLLAVNGSFTRDSRVVMRVYDPKDSNESGTKPFFSALASSSTDFAVIDYPMAFAGDHDQRVFVVVAEVNGDSITAEPSEIALSPLAVSMKKCTSCTSGWCFGEQCVCIWTENRTAHFCEVTPSPPPTISGQSRLFIYFLFLLLVAAVAGFVGISISRGASRKAEARKRNPSGIP